MNPVITAIELKPEDRKEYEEIVARLRGLAERSVGPMWSFVKTQPIAVNIGGAKLI